jgi:CDP-glucose 4,6-dehydratase
MSEAAVSPTPAFWHGRKVLLTGHTGFKGSWLGLWLATMGAKVTGLALPPETTPALFDQIKLSGDVSHRNGDIRDADAVAGALDASDADVVFHLAAQPLVLRGYREPVETWAINVVGAAQVLDAICKRGTPCIVILVTSDKVYWNNEWDYGYRETDRLGGHDPYSASKAGAELVIESWRRSFAPQQSVIRLASARAGNVIGAGDWAENRIVPDVMRALAAGRPVDLRNPRAIRPWQHVLEPLAGYIVLAEALATSADPTSLDAMNFGPNPDAERSVADLVAECLSHWPGSWRDLSDPAAPHEAAKLSLNIERARARLGWRPRWSFAQTISETVQGYRVALQDGGPALRAHMLAAIERYQAGPMCH